MRKTVEAALLTAALALASTAMPEQPRPPQNIAAPAKLPAFEVVSVQQDKSPEPLTRRFQTTGDGVVIEGLTLKDLIAFAYGFGWNHILDGPNWINNARFSIQAKVAESDLAALKAVPPLQRNRMLRPILEDRFHLQVHVETRTLPIFELVAAKAARKFRLCQPNPPTLQIPLRKEGCCSTEIRSEPREFQSGISLARSQMSLAGR